MRNLSKEQRELIRASIERAIPSKPVAIDRTGVLIQVGDLVRYDAIATPYEVAGLTFTPNDRVRLAVGPDRRLYGLSDDRVTVVG